MATLTQAVGTRTALTCTGLATLASATYVVSNAYVCDTNKPIDVAVEVSLASTNTVASKKQACVFIKLSLDNSVFTSGPESSTTTTDEPDLVLLGIVPMKSSTTTHTQIFSVLAALGFVPYAFKLVIKNEINVAMTSGAIYTSEISEVIA